MEAIIAKLVNRFERGALSRRDLIQGLTLLTAVGAGESVALAQETTLKPAKIDHISVQVSDLPRSVAFYEKLFGFTILSEDKPNEIVRLGLPKDATGVGAGKVLVSLHHKSPTGIVDHYAIGVEKFNKDAVTRQLKDQGVTASDNLDAGFHFIDPDGISVQIVGA